MTILRSGASKEYSDNFERAFGKKKATKGVGGTATGTRKSAPKKKKAAAKASPKKKAAPKKAAKKSAKK